MLWGVESNITERFEAAGIPKENISFSRETFVFSGPFPPASFVERFKNFYGPTMNAFAAAEKNGKEAELQTELEDLFNKHNTTNSTDTTSIPATFMLVSVAC